MVRIHVRVQSNTNNMKWTIKFKDLGEIKYQKGDLLTIGCALVELDTHNLLGSKYEPYRVSTHPSTLKTKYIFPEHIIEQILFLKEV